MRKAKTKAPRVRKAPKLPTFTARDQRAAMKEGWFLDTSENCVVADDDSARFTNNGASDDDAAMAYVVGRADAGCRRAIRALQITWAEHTWLKSDWMYGWTPKRTKETKKGRSR